MEYKPDIVSLPEPIVSGAKADKIIAKLGFQYSHRVEAIGFSGGVWLGWKDFIPWMAIGDFNAILAPSEKSGSLIEGRRYPHFRDFVDSGELHDLGFKGPPFTWHRAGWIKHSGFENFFKENWDCSGNFTETLGRFTHKLKEWNKNVYGNITTLNKDLINRTACIQKRSDYYGTHHLNQIDLSLRKELENVLYHEELLWRFPHLDLVDITFLGKPVSNEEIKVALFDMAPLKALGSDGFHALFFQKQWDFIGGTVCD
ncbi:hypothetical protein PVK06_016441 [Gossypium arboreum]|uniref:Uncharacterized protein n=1 Tax=Gossypium arboreum TaxID=29729 RepID=A0ABR0Q0R2_GOSAR|nr:hypothetical protein PVK06_016441 [Gossypium arboreum]